MTYDMTASLPGPHDILRKQFANGVTVLIRANSDSRSAAITGNLECPSALDPIGKGGVADFMASCLTAGTAKRDFNEINETLESAGASLGFSAECRCLSFRGQCLAEDLTMLLELLLEVLDQPSFPTEHLENIRSRTLSAYELHLHDPESMTDEAFDALLYPNHPFGRPDYDSVESIRGISREDVIEFHRRWVGPDGMNIAISGGVNPAEVMDVCERIFGGWHKPQEHWDENTVFPEILKPTEPRTRHIEIPEKSEMSLVIGTLGPKRSDPCWQSAALGNCILGEFGMMGRIGAVVREENGLAYYAGSSMNAVTNGGSWSVSAGVNPENVELAAELIIQELRRFTTERVTAEELDDVQSFYIGALPLSLESNAGVARAILNMENHHLGLDYLTRVRERVMSVTRESILETARQWLDLENLVRVTAGTAVPK